MKPGPLLMLGGGVAMFLGAILDWRGGQSGINFDSMGLFGLLTLVIGAAVAGVAIVRAFAPQVSLPENIMGFSLTQCSVAASLTVFLWTFGTISAEFVDFGLHLAWIGGAAAVAGGVMAGTESTTSAPTGPPQQF